jgi:hypothetical protein
MLSDPGFHAKVSVARPEDRATLGGELLTGGMEVCPQTAQIGLLGIFLAGFVLEYRMIYDVRHSKFFEHRRD